MIGTRLLGSALALGAIVAGSVVTERALSGSPRVEEVAIGADPVASENETAVALNPANERHVVVGSHRLATPDSAQQECVAYASRDSGRTWSAPVPMPLRSWRSYCNDPALAYAADGGRVYYAYIDRRGGDWDIVVSHSDDDGRTWAGPAVALRSTFDAYYDKPWIATARDAEDAMWVYVTATRFDTETGACQIVFSRSTNRGVAGSWSEPKVLARSGGRCGEPVLVHGAKPAGGRDGAVLVAWYDSGSDGPRRGAFRIRTRFSTDHGRTWSTAVTAARDSHEASQNLGPNGRYHRWFATMFPDVVMDGRGHAHVVYTHDPVVATEGAAAGEDGDVRYVSAKAPYRSWSTPTTVNDDDAEMAQGFAAVDVGGRRVHILWVDHRKSPRVAPNLLYDAYASSRPLGGRRWSAGRRISAQSSVSDWLFTTDYSDIAAGRRTVFGVWTDRRAQSEVEAVADDVYGVRIGVPRR